VGTYTVSKTMGAQGIVISASDIQVGALPAAVQNGTCQPNFVTGGSQATIPQGSCDASFLDTFDISVPVNQTPQNFNAIVQNCSSRVPGGETDYDIELTNPLKTDDPTAIIATAIRAGLGVIGSLTLVAFVAGGVMWVTSAGNADRVKQGLNTMLYAAIGIAVIFTAYAVLQFVLNSVGAA